MAKTDKTQVKETPKNNKEVDHFIISVEDMTKLGIVIESVVLHKCVVSTIFSALNSMAITVYKK